MTRDSGIVRVLLFALRGSVVSRGFPGQPVEVRAEDAALLVRKRQPDKMHICALVIVRNVQEPPHAIGGGIQCYLPGVLIDQVQHPRRAPVLRLGAHEVVTPHMVAALRPESHARSIVEPQPSSRLLLLRNLRPFATADSLDPILAHSPVVPFDTATSTCRSRLTICSGVCFFPPRAIQRFFRISFSHLNWYKKRRALHKRVSANPKSGVNLARIPRLNGVQSVRTALPESIYGIEHGPDEDAGER